jgi:hypothetical protein
MRLATITVVLGSLAVAPALVLGACNGATTSPDAGGSTTPTQDGALCACATPDCLPSCSDLPVCKLKCAGEGVLQWVDSCGNIDYAQACAPSCLDGSVDDAPCGD